MAKTSFNLAIVAIATLLALTGESQAIFCDYPLDSGRVSGISVQQVGAATYFPYEQILNGTETGDATIVFTLPFPSVASLTGISAADLARVAFRTPGGAPIDQSDVGTTLVGQVVITAEDGVDLTGRIFFQTPCIEEFTQIPSMNPNGVDLVRVEAVVEADPGMACTLTAGQDIAEVMSVGVPQPISINILATSVSSLVSSCQLTRGWITALSAIGCGENQIGCTSCSGGNTCTQCYQSGVDHAVNPFSTAFLYLHDGTCVDACPDGTYADENTSACVDISDCPDGFYESMPATATSNRQCEMAATCDEESFYQLAPATATSDTVCEPNPPCSRPLLKNGDFPVCQNQCPQGSFANPEATGGCEECPAGTQVSASGCEECPAGYTDDDDNPLTPCVRTPCTIPEIYDTVAETCVACTGNFQLPSATREYRGQCADLACPPGTYNHDMDVTTPCIACDAGSFLDAMAMECTPCASLGNTFTDHDLRSETACVECTNEVFAHTGECSDVMCPPNTRLTIGVCLPDCMPGEGYDPDTEQCVPCTLGTFSVGGVQPSCLPHSVCSAASSPPTYTLIEGTLVADTVCQQCVSGCPCTPSGQQTCTVASAAQASSADNSSTIIYIVIGAVICIVLILLAILYVRRKAPKDAGNGKNGVPSSMASKPMPPSDPYGAPVANSMHTSTSSNASVPMPMTSASAYDTIDSPHNKPQSPESLYDTADVPRRVVSNTDAGRDIYGGLDTTAVYSEVQRPQNQHPDNLIYAELNHSTDGTGIQRPIRGTAEPESMYADISASLTLRQEAEDLANKSGATYGNLQGTET